MGRFSRLLVLALVVCILAAQVDARRGKRGKGGRRRKAMSMQNDDSPGSNSNSNSDSDSSSDSSDSSQEPADPCAPDICDPNATCDPVTDDCVCNGGFTGDGTSCTADDPCASVTCTDPNASCDPATGQCTCNVGWEGDGNTCTDINECAASPSDSCDGSVPLCQDCTPIFGICTDTDGSFTCACIPTYTGTGRGPNGCTPSTPLLDGASNSQGPKQKKNKQKKRSRGKKGRG